MLRAALERATRPWVYWRRLPVEFHRAHVMEKLGARNTPDLMRLALLAEQTGEPSAEDAGPLEQPRVAIFR